MNLLLNPLIPIVPYSGRTTGFCWSVLAECHFGVLLTRTSKEGLPLIKEEMAEYFPLLYFGGGHRLQEGEGTEMLQGI